MTDAHTNPDSGDTGLSSPEQAIERLRGTMDGVFRDLTGLAACMLPLLQALDWKGQTREIAEALPHFVTKIELVDVRNALVNLGFETAPSRLTLSKLDPRLTPFIFVPDTEEDEDDVLIVLAARAGSITVWQKGEIKNLSYAKARIDGTAYYISRRAETDKTAKPHIFGWFGHILGRFQNSIKMLFVVSMCSNLIGIAFPLFIMFIYDHVIRMQSMGTLPMIVLGVLLFMTADAALRYIRAKVIGFVAGRLDYILGTKTFERIFRLPPSYTERASVSVQLSRIKEFESIRDYFTGPLVGATIDLPFLIIALSVIGVMSGALVLVPLTTVAIYIALAVLMLPSSRQLKKESGAANAKRDDLMVEMLLTRKSLKQTAAETVWAERYRLASAEASKQKQRSENHEAALDAMCYAIQLLSGLAILGIGTLLVIDGTITIGALIATMMLTWKMLSPIQSAFLAYTKLDQILNSTRQLNTLMNLKTEGNSGKARHLIDHVEGDIAFDRVSFRYSAETDPALLGASFKVEKNTTVAITGSTSSGKTTIAKLMLGLYAPQGGVISIGGLDLRQIDPRDLRCKIGYAPQDLQFFYGTIEQNLRLAEPTATDNQIRRAVESMGLLEEIEALPEKFHTRINLSSNDQFAPGFLQRLNIARALVRDTPILLLDEPAQRLDHEGDAALIEQLKALHGTKTILMISHRPSHIRLADKAILMTKSMVEFEGSPEDVLKYAAAKTQARG